MRTIGTKDKFALTIGPQSGQMRQVEVWAGSKNLSPVDSSVYIPSFSHALTNAATRLKKADPLFSHEGLFGSLDVESAFDKLATQAPGTEQAWVALRFVDWGPTTDDFLCFLIPLNGQLHLVCSDQDSNSLHEVILEPTEIIHVIEGAINELSNSSGTSNVY